MAPYKPIEKILRFLKNYIVTLGITLFDFIKKYIFIKKKSNEKVNLIGAHTKKKYENIK